MTTENKPDKGHFRECSSTPNCFVSVLGTNLHGIKRVSAPRIPESEALGWTAIETSEAFRGLRPPFTLLCQSTPSPQSAQDLAGPSGPSPPVLNPFCTTVEPFFFLMYDAVMCPVEIRKRACNRRPNCECPVWKSSGPASGGFDRRALALQLRVIWAVHMRCRCVCPCPEYCRLWVLKSNVASSAPEASVKMRTAPPCIRREPNTNPNPVPP